MSVELSDAFLARIAGWEAMKQGRALLAADRVLSSNWTPPVLKGVVQEGSVSYRAGLVIKSERDIENICTCRAAREWGTICAHSVGVGLHHLRRVAREAEQAAGVVAARGPASARPPAPVRRIQRAAAGESGEPLAISVILPPNLATSAGRGKVMLVFEAQWRDRRTPLNALPTDRRFAVDAADAALLDAVEALTGGEAPAMVMIAAEEFANLLPALAGHPRVTLGKSAPVTIRRTPASLALQATLRPDGEIVLALKSSGGASVWIGGTWRFANETLEPVALPETCRELWRGPVRLSRSEVPRFLSQDWPLLQSHHAVEANFSADDFALAPETPRFLLHLAGGLGQLQAQLQCAYGSRIVTAGSAAPGESLWMPDPAQPTRYATRDLAAEQAAVQRLTRSGFVADTSGRYRLAGENAVLNFLAREFPRLEKAWKVTLEERLERSTAQKLERVQPRFEVTASGVQWFDLSVTFESADGQRFSAADIQRLLLAGQGHARLRNGRIAVFDTGAVEELQEVLLDCAPTQREGRYRLASSQAGFLDATLQAQNWQVQAPATWRELARRQSGEVRPVCPPLGDLEPVLRPYQKEGVAWLRFLRDHGFGGILADEMGLGKTLQTLAFLQSTRPGAGPWLVVCPTSLVFNWSAEAERFTPRLKVLALHGPDRHGRFEQMAQSDLVITSYALLRRDLERYRETEFDTVVLDEAQHIKNRQTQNAQAVKALRSRHRLVLTGTPLENSVLDLWSLFDFLMPGWLGPATEFRERYEVPITRHQDAAAQNRLRRRLRPFLLRRLKRDVAPELPARIEQVAYCELTSDQSAMYQQLLAASRQEIFAAAGNASAGRNRMLVLNALLRLRQVCCDLRLLKLETGEGIATSGKVELFGELLEEVLDGGHRVLVFSQFVSMLTLLRQALDAEGVEYCYLDGSTTDRAAVVGRFQSGATPVFLISLKAGGTGLNLSAADTVIHFDPWWNPAVEAQATDRAHRLGQTRLVTSYKLITRGTVEEKILLLQRRKREVIQATLGGEEAFVEALTWEEIEELFAPDSGGGAGALTEPASAR